MKRHATALYRPKLEIPPRPITLAIMPGFHVTQHAVLFDYRRGLLPPWIYDATLPLLTGEQTDACNDMQGVTMVLLLTSTCSQDLR